MQCLQSFILSYQAKYMINAMDIITDVTRLPNVPLYGTSTPLEELHVLILATWKCENSPSANT